MPSGLASGPKFRSVKGGGKWRIAPDFTVTTPLVAAAQFGADAGITAFVVPSDVNGAVFLGGTEVHTTAGVGSVRVKKVVAGSTDAIGAAPDADNIDISDAIDMATAANTPLDFDALETDAVNILAPGDRVGIASEDGVTSLAGSQFFLRFAWL